MKKQQELSEEEKIKFLGMKMQEHFMDLRNWKFRKNKKHGGINKEEQHDRKRYVFSEQ